MSTPPPSPPVLLSLAVNDTVHVYPGQHATVRVAVRTAGSPGAHREGPLASLESLHVEVVGVDETTPVVIEAANPGEQTIAELPVRLPVGTPAGRLELQIRVTPLDGASMQVGATVTADVMLTIGESAGLGVEILPTVPHGNGRRRFRILLDNRSTEALDVDVRVAPAEGLRVRLRSSHAAIAPRSNVVIRGRLRARHRLVGPVRRLPFVVTAQGATTPAHVNAVYEQRPTLNGSPTKLLAVVLVVALWAGAAYAGVTAIANHQRKTSQQASASALAAAAAAQRSNQAAAKANAVGAVAKGAKAAASASAAEAAAVARAGMQINGTVTGPAPGGVTVTIEPTSVVDERTLGATDVSTASGLRPAAYVTGQDPLGKLPASALFHAAPSVVSDAVSVTTAPDGAWFIAGVKAPGYYLLTFDKAGFTERKLVIAPTPGVQLPPITVALTPGSGELAGTVTNDRNTALGGVQVTISDGTHVITTATPTTGEIGHWSVSGLATPGHYVVSASRAGYGATSQEVDLSAPPAGATESSATVNLSMPTGTTTVSGRAMTRDPSGRPVPFGGATVTVSSRSFSRSTTTVNDPACDPEQPTTPACQLQGFWSISGVPIPDTYTVTIVGPGVAPSSQTITLAPGSPASPVSGNPAPSTTADIKGTITDAKTGAGVDEAGVTLSGDGGTYKVLASSAPSGDDPTGTYEIDGLAPGSYVLSVSRFGYEPASYGVTLKGGVLSVQPPLELTPTGQGSLTHQGFITGYAVDARTGKRIETCPAGVVGPAGCLLTATTSETTTGPDGKASAKPFSVTGITDENYTLPSPDPSASGNDGLLPGQHTVTVAIPGYEDGSVAVNVPLAATVSASPVALQPTATLTGVLGVLAGRLPATTCVTAVPYTADGVAAGCTVHTGTGSSDPTTCSTDKPDGRCAVVDSSTGSYTIANLIHGSYEVQVIAPSPYVSVAPVDLDIQLGQTETYDPIVHRLAEIDVSLQVPDATGKLSTPASGSVSVTVTSTGTDAFTQTRSNTGADGGSAAKVIFPALTPPDDQSNGERGAFRVTASGDATENDTTVTASYDQTVSVSLVVTNHVTVDGSTVAAGTINSLTDNIPTIARCAELTITGTTGYTGGSADTSTVNVWSDTNGAFTLAETAPSGPAATDCSASQPSVVALPLVVPTITVTYADTGGLYENASFTSDVSTGKLPVTLTVKPVSLTGSLQPTVQLDPAPAAGTPNPYAGVKVLVTATPPGAGSVNITVNPAGNTDPGTGDYTGTNLVWQDSSLPTNEAVPGTYTVALSAPGYQDYNLTISIEGANIAQGPNYFVPTPGHVPTQTTTFSPVLSEGTEVDIQACDGSQASCPTLNGLVVVLSNSAGTPAQSFTGTAGSSAAVFPALPSRDSKGNLITYRADVRVAGYAFHLAADDAGFTVTPSTTPQVETYTLTRLGSISGTVQGQPATPGYAAVALGGVNVKAAYIGAFTAGTTNCPSTTAPSGAKTFSAVTANDGTFTVTGDTVTAGLVPGCYQMTVAGGTAPTGYQPLASTAYVVTVTGNEVENWPPSPFTAAPVSLTINVTFHTPSGDDNGDPPTAVLTNSGSGNASTQPTTITGTQGCTAPGCSEALGPVSLDPVTYTLVVSAQNFGTVTTTVTLMPGQTNPSANVVLGTSLSTVNGTVILQPISGVSVPAGQPVTIQATSRTNTSQAPITPNTAVVTRKNQTQYSFILSGLLADPKGYDITVQARGTDTNQAEIDFLDPARQNVVTTTGSTSSLSFTLVEASTNAVVTLSSSAGGDESGLANTPIKILDTDTNGYVSFAAYVNYATAAADGSITATFSQLPQGDYTLSAPAENGHQKPPDTSFTVPRVPDGKPPADLAEAMTISESSISGTVSVQKSSSSQPPLVTISAKDGSNNAISGASTSLQVSSSSAFTLYIPGQVPAATLAGYTVNATSSGYSSSGDVGLTSSQDNQATASSTLTLVQQAGLDVNVTQGDANSSAADVLVVVYQAQNASDAFSPPATTPAPGTANGQVGQQETDRGGNAAFPLPPGYYNAAAYDKNSNKLVAQTMAAVQVTSGDAYQLHLSVPKQATPNPTNVYLSQPFADVTGTVNDNGDATLLDLQWTGATATPAITSYNWTITKSVNGNVSTVASGSLDANNDTGSYQVPASDLETPDGTHGLLTSVLGSYTYYTATVVSVSSAGPSTGQTWNMTLPPDFLPQTSGGVQTPLQSVDGTGTQVTVVTSANASGHADNYHVVSNGSDSFDSYHDPRTGISNGTWHFRYSRSPMTVSGTTYSGVAAGTSETYTVFDVYSSGGQDTRNIGIPNQLTLEYLPLTPDITADPDTDPTALDVTVTPHDNQGSTSQTFAFAVSSAAGSTATADTSACTTNATTSGAFSCTITGLLPSTAYTVTVTETATVGADANGYAGTTGTVTNSAMATTADLITPPASPSPTDSAAPSPSPTS